MNPSIDQSQFLKRFSFLNSFALLSTFFLILLLIIPVPQALADYTWEGVPSSYGLKWSDEFNGTTGSAPNSANWSYETGAGGWGNNELENYTTSTANSQVIADAKATDGKSLGIIVLDPGGNNDVAGSYTSARLNTNGKQTFTYGYMVARGRMPYGQGIWPAFWMMGTNIGSVGWPTCDEIDIMENIGNSGDQPNNHSSLHDGNDTTQIFNLPGGQLFRNAYHTFSALWQNNEIQFYVDGNLFETDTPATMGNNWLFNHANYFLLNCAAGGSWPGNPDGSTSFPQTMAMDYVRVYQTGLATPTPVVQSTWRVRCGGDNYTDSQGNLWVADTNFTGGWPAATSNAISGALPASSDQALYQYERYGNATGGETVTYTFNVPTGSTYQATLKFSENYWTGAGQRLFNATINGSSVLSGFDIYAAAGGEFKAVDKVFSGLSPNGSGQIVIQLTKGSADEPKVAAIQIIAQTTPTFTPTFTKTNTPVPPTNTFTSTSTKTNTPVPPTNTFTFTSTHTLSPTGTNTATRTNTPTYTNTNTPVPPTNSFTPTNTLSPTGTSTATRTNTATSTNSNTPVPPTNTFTFTRTNTPINTSTNTPIPPTNSFTPTDSTTPTRTNSSTNTPAPPTITPTPTFTGQPTATFTYSFTNTSTATKTNTPLNTNTSTNTPVPPTNSFTPTSTDTRTHTPTSTNTNSPVPATNTPSFTFTSTNSPVATATSTFTKTFTPMATSTTSFTATPTRTNSPVPPTATASYTATATPTFTLSPFSSFTPTLSFTPARTATFSPTRTFTPRPGPTPPVVIYPNPSSGGPVSIHIPGLSGVSDVRVEIFTSAFRKVKDQDFGQVPAGTDLSIQMTDRWGNPLASGLYYVVVFTDHGKYIAKLLLLR